MKDHLGNVRAVVSDVLQPTENATEITSLTADVVSATDYYAFGAIMPGRNFSSNTYRYGFNGKEKDDEVKGSGNSLDFGARIYDPRTGRWLTLDPKVAKYPGFSGYNFALNNPISIIDPDGKDIYFVNRNAGMYDKPILLKQNFKEIINILNSAPGGKEMIDDYIKNPTKDLYISIGNTQDKSDLGEHFTFKKDGKIDTPPTVEIGKNSYMIDEESSTVNENFTGIIIDTKKENHFIVLDKDIFGKENIDTKGAKRGAIATAHEIGAHTDNPLDDGPTSHEKYGQFYEGGPATGRAAKVNGEVNKLLNSQIKSDLKLTETGQSGVSKVENKK